MTNLYIDADCLIIAPDLNDAKDYHDLFARVFGFSQWSCYTLILLKSKLKDLPCHLSIRIFSFHQWSQLSIFSRGLSVLLNLVRVFCFVICYYKKIILFVRKNEEFNELVIDFEDEKLLSKIRNYKKKDLEYHNEKSFA